MVASASATHWKPFWNKRLLNPTIKQALLFWLPKKSSCDYTHFSSDMKVMSGKPMPLLFACLLRMDRFDNNQTQHSSIRICCTNVFRITYKKRFYMHSNASPSFTSTISLGKFALGIPLIKKLHKEALLPFLIIPSLKSESG